MNDVKQSRIIWDFAGLIVSKVVGQGAEVITISLIAHRYGLEDYSVLFFALSVTVMVRVTGVFGLDKWAIREIAVQKGEHVRIVSDIFAVQLRWLILLYLLYTAGIFCCLPDQKILFLAAGLYQFAYAILYVIYGIAAGYEYFELERMTSMVVGSALLIMTLVLYWKQVPVELMIAVLFIFQLFMKRLYPVLARKEGHQQYLHRNLLLILGTGLAFHGLTVMLAPILIKTIFGIEFLPAIHLLKMGSLAVPVLLMNEYFATLCAVGKREVEMKRISFIGVLVLTIAGCYWIPRYHVEGAMWAYLTSEMIKWLIYYLELSEHCHSEGRAMEVV